jgi:hypothetical protein
VKAALRPRFLASQVPDLRHRRGETGATVVLNLDGIVHFLVVWLAFLCSTLPSKLISRYPSPSSVLMRPLGEGRVHQDAFVSSMHVFYKAIAEIF